MLLSSRAASDCSVRPGRRSRSWLDGGSWTGKEESTKRYRGRTGNQGLVYRFHEHFLLKICVLGRQCLLIGSACCKSVCMHLYVYFVRPIIPAARGWPDLVLHSCDQPKLPPTDVIARGAAMCALHICTLHLYDHDTPRIMSTNTAGAVASVCL